MKIRYFGHAAVGLVSRGGTRVLLDPYLPGAFEGGIGYGPIPGEYDLVIVSHEHLDHNHVAPSFGRPAVVKAPGIFEGMDIRMFAATHGDNCGTMDFETRVSMFVLDDMRIVHPGDIGGPVPDELVANLSGTDILFVPVGGRFTHSPEEAALFVKQVRPRVAIPIHYKTSKVGLPLLPVDDFLNLMPLVKRFPSGEVDLNSGTLPVRTEVWALNPTC